MKKIFYIFLSLSIMVINTPVYAIESSSTVIPLVGMSFESANEKIAEKIDLIPIKLPEKVGHFDLLEAERALAPNILKDEVGLWTAPFRTKYKDLIWLVPVSGVLTTLFLVDDKFSKALTNNHRTSDTQDSIAKAFAQIGGYAPVLGLPGGLILTGVVIKNDRLRETGILQYEGLVNAAIIGTTAQAIAGRNKPNNGRKGRGEFFEGGTSFPSGHSISSWTLASIAAHQYSDKKWVAVVGYSLATLVSSSRILQDTHFPADAFAGAAFGYLLGRYIVKHRSEHSPFANKKREEHSKLN